MILRVVFFLFSTALFVGANVFVYRRLIGDTTRNRQLRQVGAVSLGIFFMAPPLLRVFFREEAPPPLFAAAVMSWWGFMMYVLAALVAIELGRWMLGRWNRTKGTEPQLPVDEDRRVVLSRMVAGSALAFGGTVSSFGVFRAFRPPEISEVAIRLRGLPKSLDGFTIAQLSDIHIGPYFQERMIDQLVSLTNGLKADLVAITGDVVDGSPGQLMRFVSRLGDLKSRFGTYMVSGNHEYYSKWEQWIRPFESTGIEILRNRMVQIGDVGGTFDLIGVDDYGAKWQPGEYDLDLATRLRDPSRPSVLLAHQPTGLDEAAAKSIGLQLSGHTHGGQMFPATVLGQAIWGDRNAGLSSYEGLQIYTSRGCGCVGPPMRVGASPEIVKIVLMPA